jgi:hypothetical protein
MTRRIGIALLLLVIVAVTGYQLTQRKGGSGIGPGGPGGPARASGPAATVKGVIGGEKQGLLDDPQVAGLLRDRYGLTVDASRAGSIDMVRSPSAGQDFLWPSSQIALEIYRDRGQKMRKAEILFNSPMVLYSHQIVTDALIKHGLVRRELETYYIIRAEDLVRMVIAGKQWKEIGLTQLYGKMAITSTDPARSNSGTMFAGLLANLLNGGEVVEPETLPKVLPEVKRFFGRQGYLQGSSSDLFNQFLQQGVGSYPLIVGYEAQLVEFSLQNAQALELLRKEINTLYPRPTVWSSHPLIALTAGGERLLTALKDPDIQRLAWEKHGFRSGMIGVTNDPKVLQVTGVPAAVENVIPIPKPRVMEKIIGALNDR